MHRWRSFAVILAVLSLPLATHSRAQGPIDPGRVRAQIPAFEAYINQSMARTGVPGLAVAIVASDQVVYLKGFGVRQVGQTGAVSPDSVFQLASLSKPVGSTVVAGLVGLGIVKWDDRIAALIPGFRMSLPDTTARVTVRDMLSHQSGLPEYAGDVLVDVGVSRHNLIERTRFITLEAPLRAHYAYSNVGYTIGAVAAARPTGWAWEDLSAALLYWPLGMWSTSSRYAQYVNAPNRATGHVRINGAWIPRIPPNDDDAEAPAGGVSSTARDMANYLRLQLRGGRFDGRTVISPSALAETHRPQVVSQPGNPPGYYGLGWNVSTDAAGRARLNHSGAFSSGASTVITFYPNEDIGIVVLCNGFPIGFPEAMATGFFQLLFEGGIAGDPVGQYEQAFDHFWKEIEAHYPAYPPPPVPPAPARPLAFYLGTYANELYGAVEVVPAGRGLAIRLGPRRVTYPLSHYSGDLFLFHPVGENAYAPSGAHFGFARKGPARWVTVDYYNPEGKGTLGRVGN